MRLETPWPASGRARVSTAELHGSCAIAQLRTSFAQRRGRALKSDRSRARHLLRDGAPRLFTIISLIPGHIR
jgi:hypothetical protein